MAGCPFLARQQKFDRNPQKLNLHVLNPPEYLNTTYDYAKEFASLNMDELKKEIVTMLKTSQDWWPADYGHYGPFMVRLAWHSSGTYRMADGRGGGAESTIRFYPHNSWPDNGNLDKAVRLLWPVKQKYGRKISWADLIILVGNVAMEDMGFKTFGFGGGRIDNWATDESAYWGEAESYEGLANDPSKLEQPLGAAVMRLIYVNPEGPDGIPDPVLAAAHIRETFGRMGMNDEETVALVAGGHTFGKCHGAAPGDKHVGAEPELSSIEAQGTGWANSFGIGKGGDAITSGLEGAWTTEPTKWDNGYFHNLFAYEWELHKGPGGAQQWKPVEGGAKDAVPDAHDAAKKHAPMMLTTDLAMIKDPKYKEVSERFNKDHEAFKLAFGKAWFKLTHRDMGPVHRLIGKEVPPAQLWQDPINMGVELKPDHAKDLKNMIAASGLSVSQLIHTAWSSACTYRKTDHRGGTDGGRLRFSPQKDWEINCPDELAQVLAKLGSIKEEFAKTAGVSMADLIVLAGNWAVEKAAEDAKFPISIAFASGRGDATAEQTDAAGVEWLRPASDPFRNFNPSPYKMIDMAHKLGLTAPEMVTLIGGLRVLGGNHRVGGKPCPDGMFTDSPGVLSTDYFRNLLDMDLVWEKAGESFKGVDRKTKVQKYTASSVDMAIGSNPSLRAIAEHYACGDGRVAFMTDFARSWRKVMNNGLPSKAAKTLARQGTQGMDSIPLGGTA